MLRIIAGVTILAASASASSAPLAFAKTLVVPIGNEPVGIVVADFNHDGNMDVAARNGSIAKISVALGSLVGTFNTAVSYPTSAENADANAQSLVVADFNKDDIPDLAVPNQYGSSPMPVSVFLGNPDGTFPAQAALFPSGTCPVAIAADDFNGDRKTDLVTADFEGTSVSVLLGQVNGTFASPVNYAVGSFPNSVIVGDFNGDEKPDLLVANEGSSNISLLTGMGDGTFAAEVSTPIASPLSLAAADLDGDGKLDVVVAAIGSDVSVLLGHGDGTFASAVSFPTGAAYKTNAVALADLDGDGRLDIIAANGSTLSILRGFGNGTFSSPISIDSINDATSIAVADFNGDDRLDLVVTNSSSGTFTLLTNDVLFSAGFEAR